MDRHQLAMLSIGSSCLAYQQGPHLNNIRPASTVQTGAALYTTDFSTTVDTFADPINQSLPQLQSNDSQDSAISLEDSDSAVVPHASASEGKDWLEHARNEVGLNGVMCCHC